MVYNSAGFLVAKVDISKCQECGLCLETCPGEGIPNNLLYFKDVFWGHNISAYIGHANDPELWRNGQSGGIVSALLLFLLDAKLVEGAVVNRFDLQKKRPYPIIARNREEIIKAQGSIYAHSAPNKIVLETKEKIAAVLLGCQAEGIMLSREKLKKNSSPAYIIGLMCAGNYSRLMIDRLISKSKINKDKIISFKFRDKDEVGWPGDLSIKTISTTYRVRRNLPGVERVEGDMEFTRIRKHYWNYRCLFCYDQMNLFSDVVVGDPWGINITNKKLGESVFIARTSKGKELLEEVLKKKIITAKPIDVNTIYRGQTVDTRLKNQYYSCINIARVFKLPLPKYTIQDGIFELNISKRVKSKYIWRMKFLHLLYKGRTEFGVKLRILRARFTEKAKFYLRLIYKRLIRKNNK